MYADAVHLHVRAWSRFDNIEEERWSTTVPVGSHIELDFDDLQAAIEQALGARPGSERDRIEGPGPGPYKVSVKEERFEAGGSGATVEVVLAIEEWAGMVAWGVLGSMIADYLRSRSDRED